MCSCRRRTSNGCRFFTGTTVRCAQKMSEPPSTPFNLEKTFPPVIFSYCTATDGGRGEAHMWRLANLLKQHGIASFNGKQVQPGEDWLQKWLGKMPEAKVCLALLSAAYFQSGPCKEELYETLREGIPVIPIIFEQVPKLQRGYFGDSDDAIEKGNFVKRKLGNFLPPPDQVPPACHLSTQLMWAMK